jgi:hypothetical protein
MGSPEPVGAEIVQFRPRNTLNAKVDYAEKLAQSGLLPAAYKKQPANVLYAVEYGEMLGLPPMAAITGIHVIEGKPTASAALISALVRRAGHRLRVTGNDKQATAQIIRKDDPDFTFEAVWTLERAKQANLTGKGVWKQYPAAMLKARAITEVARDACEEALCGMHYTPEELGAEVNEEGTPVILDAEVEPAIDWDAEIKAAGDDLNALRELWKRARGHDDVLAKIKARVQDVKAAEPKKAEPQVVEAEIVAEPQPAKPTSFGLTDLVDQLLAAATVETVEEIASQVDSKDRAARTDISGIVPDQAATELHYDKTDKIRIAEFSDLVLGYVAAEGCSVNEGIKVAAAEQGAA